MVKYSVEISRSAERQLKRIEREDQLRLLRAIGNLARDPFPPGCRKLQGYDDVLRIRIAAYRVLYSVEKKRVVVIVLKIGHRRDVYR